MANKISRAGKYFFLGGGVTEIFEGAMDFSGDAYLERLAFAPAGGFGVTSVDLSGCTALQKVGISNIAELTSLDISGCASLTYADLFGNGLTTLTLGTNTLLAYMDCSGNALTTLDISGCPALTELYAGATLTEAAVDAILDSLDTAGLINGTVDISGGTNAIPSAAGLTSKANLLEKGWTVKVNA